VARPIESSTSLPSGVSFCVDADSNITPSNELIGLLVRSREGYCWPSGQTPAESQKTIVNLEEEVQAMMPTLETEKACSIITRISNWGGNNAASQRKLEEADTSTKQAMKEALQTINGTQTLERGLRALCDLAGINLVMASKIYRFCFPDQGAALDRHSAYFFNSLQKVREDGTGTAATKFVREWSTAQHTTSRLAIYTQPSFERVLSEYLTVYLPLLRDIASSLNLRRDFYKSAVDSRSTEWKAADVEMAAYYWWSKHGPR
jgi:hypothetical protein